MWKKHMTSHFFYSKVAKQHDPNMYQKHVDKFNAKMAALEAGIDTDDYPDAGDAAPLADLEGGGSASSGQQPREQQPADCPAPVDDEGDQSKGSTEESESD
ncbi:unnamed protein product [Prorocentrum cordatum]|uniref:Uncharacterized protein n=1 Tax=Prorocentrum cordatum TaxID=2364126 RepID=A0ABN9W4V6_9DINO|nr:unnamed protein product [Polarella glacialis]